MFKNKYTWLLITMILLVAFVSGLETKKTAKQISDHYIAIDLLM